MLPIVIVGKKQTQISGALFVSLLAHNELHGKWQHKVHRSNLENKIKSHTNERMKETYFGVNNCFLMSVYLAISHLGSVYVINTYPVITG